MSIKIIKIKEDKQKIITTSLIVSDKFCDKIIPIFNDNKDIIYKSFSMFNRIIINWCIEYYDEYKKAPHSHIQDIYNSKKKTLNEDEQSLIKKFLLHLSDKFEREEHFNEEYIIDQAKLYIREVNLNTLQEQINELKENGKIDEAEHLILTYSKIDKETEKRQTTNIFQDIEKAKTICDFELNQNIEDQLFKLPGDIGKDLDWIYREDFFAFAAFAKKGKCITGNSDILLSDGRVEKLDNVIQNKEKKIVSFNETTFFLEKDEITNHVNVGRKDCKKIITRTGREIESAITHPFLHFSKGWIKLKELELGDYIACPKKIDFFGTSFLEDFKIKLIAYLLADGGMSHNGITFTKKEIKIKNDFRECVKKIKDTYAIRNSLTDSIVPIKRFSLSKTKKMLHEYKIKRVKSIYKEIPDIIFSLKKDLLKLFLNIMFTCDGSVFKTKNSMGIQYSSGSKILIYQLQHLLLRFGIISTINPKKVKELKHIYWVLNIKDKSNINLYLDNIGFSFSKQKKASKLKEVLKNVRNDFSFIDVFPCEMRPIIIKEIIQYKKNNTVVDNYINVFIFDRPHSTVKMRTVKRINKEIKSELLDKYLNGDIFWDRIEKIESIGLQQCYDLTVNKNHNYIANNFITHNSFYLREIARIASVDHGLNVVVFNLEMSHNKYIRNFYQSISNEIKSKDEKEIKIPYFEEENNNKHSIDYEYYDKKGLSAKSIEQKLNRTRIKTKGNIIVESFPSNTLHFNKCVQILDEYVLNGFVCDVLLIDFLDNLKTYHKGDFRHGIDDKWVNARRLAQEKHIAVGTVTHTNISTAKGNVEAGKLSEDNRKLNHITHAIGINQLSHEKTQQYSRLNIIANRDEDFNAEKFYVSLECRDIGKVMLDTKYSKNVITDDNEEEE